MVSKSRRKEGETGFSLLIKGPGIYKLRGLTIKVADVPPTGVPSADGASTEGTPVVSGFFAGLPLALRRHYPGDYILRGGRKRRAADSIRGTGLSASALITAEDARGPAAFIGRKRDGFAIVLTREEGDRKNHLFFSII
jgi:tRNA(Ile)-lysidine synthase